MVDALPVTTALRTIADLADSGIDGGHLDHVIADVLGQELADIEDVELALRPHAHRYGHRLGDGSGWVASVLEQHPLSVRKTQVVTAQNTARVMNRLQDALDATGPLSEATRKTIASRLGI